MGRELNLMLTRLTPECREAIAEITRRDYSHTELLGRIIDRVRGLAGVMMMASDERDILFPQDVSEVASAIREDMEIAKKVLKDFERQFGIGLERSQ
ncbi:hypothetical protein [Methylocaldum szegediense]|jgi:hypothetical protein|uniref:Uncharacterized protein n=1 Tax=Methylocaldum szegediense TaxID=73780 RepID=A0ABN8X9G1_9GAMM|nr:hypothetical protein [Methylocaldum szegediense]CAI8918743.1 protein of unknown function [Methylocaldum szegediense]